MKTSCELSFDILSIIGCDIAYEPKDSPEQLFYSITQVSEIVGVQPHVIRYWEKHFPGLNPGRGSSSNWRNYLIADIAALKEIKKLVNDKGMTILGAKKMLGKGKQDVSVIKTLEKLLFDLEAI